MSRNKRFILIVAAFFLQPFFTALLPGVLVPNLLFCILMIMAASMDPEDLVAPMILVSILSLLQDIYYSQYIGVGVISLMVTMLVVIWIKRLANIENPIFLVLLVLITNLVYAVIYWGIYALLSSPYSFMYMLKRLPLTAIPNIVVMFIALTVISRDLIQRRRDEYFR